MSKFLLAFSIFLSFKSVQAQTFNGTGGPIADATNTPSVPVTTCFPLTVSGVGPMTGTYGLASVCVNLTHTYDGDITILIQAPDGTTIILSDQNGSTGNNYTNTCFAATGAPGISAGTPPFTGTYIPQSSLGGMNNGQNANGVWQLCIKDNFFTEVGTLLNWSITFSNTPYPPTPTCANNPPAGDDCLTATPVCNFTGYCGNTSAAYQVDTWPELTAAFSACGGSIENNSFITFVASAATASFNVWVNSSQDNTGIQMMFYDGGCTSGAVNVHGCYVNNILTPTFPANIPHFVSATNLIPGNTYTLMFDGWGGDVCDYSLAPLSGVNILYVDPPEPSVCVGQSVVLTASGGNGTYSWTGPNLNTTTGPVVTASPTVTTIYTVTSVDPTGSCPVTLDVEVSMTNVPSPPTVTSPVNYCQGSAATPLSAVGTALLWYTAATGGTGSATAPTPSTAAIGTTTYYVTQTLTCGTSVRTPVVVNVATPQVAPAVTSPLVYCQGTTAPALTATGTGLVWYTTPTGGTGSPAAPVPSTITPGTTTYYVCQSVNGCEGPRAAITVTVNSTPTAPTVTPSVFYCQGNTAVPLTATGTSLLWFTVATGGTGVATAPTPSTTTVGATTWYVSQANGPCRGPRSSITVTVAAATPPPATSNITYCQGNTASQLTATGTSLLWYSAATGGTGSATAPTPSTAVSGTTTYYVTQTLSCGESVRKALVVTITAAPAPPAVTSPVSYCLAATPTQLSATGSGLLWYTTASGGTGSATAPTPSTAATGSTTYYVSQTIGCEGPRAAITVTVTALPAAPAVTSPLNRCQGTAAVALTATGSDLLWYTTPTGGTGSVTAPSPSTTTVGSTIYYVSQSVTGCRGPRAAIAVNILPSTPTPTAASPIVYCQGTSAVALTATGTGLLWYTTATGGTGTATAPIPSTATVGNTTYYVSQTASPCGESIRKAIVVTINSTPAAPNVTSPVIYCQGATTSAVAAAGTNLLWYSAATGGTGSSIAPVPSSATTGNTNYYVSQSIGTCEGPRALITVRINSIPLAPAATTGVTYCRGVPASALTATGSNLLWYTVATGGTGSTSAPTPSTTTAGNVIHYVSQTVNNCEGPRTAITVTTLPSTPAPTATSPIVYCQGTSAVALTATGTGLLWYTTSTGGTGTATAPIPSTATPGNTTYYVSQTASPCGESIRRAIVVSITPTPAAPTVTSPVIYCQGFTTSALTAAGSNLLWYNTATGGTGSNIAPVPSSATTGNTNYYVSQSTGTCEGPRALLSVRVNSIPVVPGVGANLTYCQGVTSNPLAATGTGLLWYTSASGGIGNATAPVPSTTAAGTTTYYVSQTVNSCEGPRDSISVDVLPYTLMPTVVSPVIFCQGGTATALTATGTSLLWYTAATGGTGSSVAPIPSTTTAGNFTFYVTQSGICGESARRPLLVKINPVPAAPATSPITHCQNSIADPLTASGINLLWYTSASGSTSTTSLIPPTTTVGNTTYYVSQTVGGCEGPRSPLVVTIVALPPPPAGSGPYTYCQGEVATALTATGTDLLWYTSATGGTESPTAPIPSTSTAGVFTYYVTQTLSCGESVRTPIIVNINPTPVAPSVISPVTYCQRTPTLALTATGSNLLWYNAATGGTGSAVAPTPSSSAVSNNNYYVSSTLGTCEGPRSLINVVVNITPAAPAVDGPFTYCQDLAVAPLTAAGTNLLWYSSAAGGVGSTSAPSNYTVNPGTTTYYVSQTTGSCEGPRAGITVTVNSYPDFGPDRRDTVCAGESVDLSALYNTTGYTFNWTLDGKDVSNPGGVTIPGMYRLEATNSLGCSDTVFVHVIIQPKVPAFAGNDTIAIKGMPHQLMASGGVAYSWTPSASLNFANIQNPLVTLNQDQQFKVTVNDVAGCKGTDVIFIKVYEGPTYYVPNAFSPNGDGLNDIFRVVPVGISQTDWFRVFNRYGQLVFETNQWLKGWDGTFMGKKQPMGNYVWMVRGTNKYGRVVEMKGTVLIVQ